jgi:hypothetical protein
MRCGDQTFVVENGKDGESGRNGEDGQDDFSTSLENAQILNDRVDENTVVLNCAATLRTNDEDIIERQIVADIFVNGNRYPFEEYVGEGWFAWKLGEFDQVIHSLDLFVGTVRAGDHVACRTTVFASRRGTGRFERVGVTATAMSEEVEVQEVVTPRVRSGYLSAKPYRIERPKREDCIALSIEVDEEYDTESDARCVVETRSGPGTTISWNPVQSAVDFKNESTYQQVVYCGPLEGPSRKAVTFETRAACVGEPALQSGGYFRWDIAAGLAGPSFIEIPALESR